MYRTTAIGISKTNPVALVSRFAETLLLWHDRARQRRRLGELDARLLADMGLSRSQALAEAGKPFWQA